MTLPNFTAKHAGESFFTPTDWLAYARSLGRVDDRPPLDGLVLCYQPRFVKAVLDEHPTTTARVPLPCPTFDHTEGRVGLLLAPIGAPAAAALLEEFIVFGTRRFISIGTAGTLQRDLAIGDVVVCDRAVRDEGVSHHYLPAALFAHPAAKLTAELVAALGGPRTGASWTIDAPFRETVEEARHYQAKGVLTVEMEAAALMAVAEYRNVDLACAFAISDSLAELTWNPQFHADATRAGMWRLLDAAVAVLASPAAAAS